MKSLCPERVECGTTHIVFNIAPLGSLTEDTSIQRNRTYSHNISFLFSQFTWYNRYCRTRLRQRPYVLYVCAVWLSFRNAIHVTGKTFNINRNAKDPGFPSRTFHQCRSLDLSVVLMYWLICVFHNQLLLTAEPESFFCFFRRCWTGFWPVSPQLSRFSSLRQFSQQGMSVLVCCWPVWSPVVSWWTLSWSMAWTSWTAAGPVAQTTVWPCSAFSLWYRLFFFFFFFKSDFAHTCNFSLWSKPQCSPLSFGSGADQQNLVTVTHSKHDILYKV